MCKSDIVYICISCTAFTLCNLDLNSLSLNLWGSRKKILIFTCYWIPSCGTKHTHHCSSSLFESSSFKSTLREMCAHLFSSGGVFFSYCHHSSTRSRTQGFQMCYFCSLLRTHSFLSLGGILVQGTGNPWFFFFSILDSIFLCWAWSMSKMTFNSIFSCLSLPSPRTATDTAWSWIFRVSKFQLQMNLKQNPIPYHPSCL